MAHGFLIVLGRALCSRSSHSLTFYNWYGGKEGKEMLSGKMF